MPDGVTGYTSLARFVAKIICQDIRWRSLKFMARDMTLGV